MASRKIEIDRNIVEKILMDLKDFVREHHKIVMYSFLGLFAAGILSVIMFLVYEKKAESDILKYEEIIENYRKSEAGTADERRKNLDKTVSELNKLIDSSYWGFVNKNGYYIIGTLYYSEKIYKEARDYCLKFAEKSPSSFFAPIALQNAAISSESLGNIDEALKIYKRLETDYGNSAIGDQIYYNLGRIYLKKGDLFKSREYYNKVITTYPQSDFAKMAKEYLFLAGYFTKKMNRKVK